MAEKDTLSVEVTDGQVVVKVGSGKSGKDVTLSQDEAVRVSKELARAVAAVS